MSNVLPISIAEFGRALTACRPPNGWGKALTVAVSGGADSIGLLWLLRSLYNEAGITEPRINGITIDHGFRPETAKEAEAVGAFCRDIGVEHQIIKVPWGTNSYPNHPEPAQYESSGRWARYWILFHAMQESGSHALLTGHQANDQLETAIMRAERESGVLGMLGMRPIRRYGMGGPAPWLNFGEKGLHAFMCRPILTFSKERLKATCQASNIPWTEDPSNLDTNLTVRNRIRATLDQIQSEGDVSPWRERLKRFDIKEQSIAKLANILDGVPPTATVDEISQHMVSEYEKFDTAVNAFLSSITTVEAGAPMLVIDTNKTPPSQDIAYGAVLRILRYVSPKWWGHPSAEALRRKDSIQRIVENLWYREPSPVDGKYRAVPFVAGSHVLWTPSEQQAQTPYVSWMATRAPPKRDDAPAMFLDLSTAVLEAAESRKSPEPILWDNRYTVCVPTAFPRHVLDGVRENQGRVILGPHSKFFLPMINYESDEKNSVLAALGTDGHIHSYLRPGGWRFEWIRPFSGH
ncbi:hypothetical protein DACRYDRAFT_114565 [Dacryopinax primogenitus]|uniref:tRNA(Ile)-lysidine synthetase n=1 Tax=Dacryopinax primogenitus (strain DJM 731) TaxID=1858805 RepID=M5G1U1_DACPD|nr:uncharacterized protein DACRYDRAFT_114565 [Dacryopinax primogenitus]EJU04166.1 hypothetical protein DACRYDRAFT_114565 [Dacryopinax primogenitus]